MTPRRSATSRSRLPLLAAAGFAALALGGCTTVAERRAYDEERCRTYGFRPGSEAFSKCLLDVDLNRDADRRAFVYGSGGFGYGYGYGGGWAWGGYGPRRSRW